MAHTIKLEEVATDIDNIMASSSSSTGVKRLIIRTLVTVNPSETTTSVLFQVTNRKADSNFTDFVYSGRSLEEAVEAYNLIK